MYQELIVMVQPWLLGPFRHANRQLQVDGKAQPLNPAMPIGTDKE